MSTHKLCFEKKYENYQNFLSKNFPFFVVKFSIYLNRRVFKMDLTESPKSLFLVMHSYDSMSASTYL